MRSCFAVLITIVLSGSPGHAQDQGARSKQVEKLINALVSENAAPDPGAWRKPPRGYDRKKQQPVLRAVGKLKALGPRGFKFLIQNWGDERYCLTYSVGSNGYMGNATVGEMCRRIMFDQIQPYGYWSLGQPGGEGDPLDRRRRPDYPKEFLADQETAAEWLEEHKDKSLVEIQLMVINWIIEQESASPNDFTDREREYMQEIRDELVKSQKPRTRGNYHNDDYGW